MKIVEAGKKYLKGGLHIHTSDSDGMRTPEEAMRLYADHGYDFIVLTDHWMTAPTRMYGDMLVMSGAEYDFNPDGNVLHLLAMFPDAEAAQGIGRHMDHRAVIDRINTAGGAAIAAHPAWSLNTPEFLRSLDGVCATEIYNTFAGEPWNVARSDASFLLDLAGAQGWYMPQIASDDSHRYEGEQCTSWVMLRADAATPEAIIDAVKRGDFYASQGPRILEAELAEGELRLRTTPVQRCVFSSNAVWAPDRCRTGENMTEHIYKIRPGERFIRCEITDAQGKKAWLSPVELK